MDLVAVSALEQVGRGATALGDGDAGGIEVLAARCDDVASLVDVDGATSAPEVGDVAREEKLDAGETSLVLWTEKLVDVLELDSDGSGVTAAGSDATEGAGVLGSTCPGVAKKTRGAASPRATQYAGDRSDVGGTSPAMFNETS